MNLLPIAGIDVGKRFSELAVLSPDNAVVARMKIYHDASANIDKAVEVLHKVEKDFAARPVVVMESTGHYHKILFYSLCKAGYDVCVINPLQTDSIKNLGIRKVKNDKVDARKVALLYRFRNCAPPTCLTKISNACAACAASISIFQMNLRHTKTVS